MLEFLRHQTKPIMITLTVIIIIAFTFWGDRSRGRGQHYASPEDTALTILGRDYTYAELQRIQRLYNIASGLRLPGAQNHFVSELTGLQLNHRRQEDGMPLEFAGAPMDFAINLIVLRDALEKFGVRASDAEAKAAFRQLGSFQVNGQFDPERARTFESQLGSMGFRINDVYDVIGDSLGFQKLQKLVAGNAVTNAKLTEQLYAATYQTIKAASIPFALETFKKTAQVKDEDIKKYFEENKENYKTAEKRAVSYVFFEKPGTEGKNAEETVKLRNAFGEKVNNFALAVINPGVKFEDEAKKAGVEIKTLPAFSQDSPPDSLKEQFSLVTAIFQNVPLTHPVSDPVESDKGYHIFKVTKIEEPKQQELKDVLDKVRDVLLTQKAQESMQKAANDAKKKLEEAIKGGKKFEDAAKEAGLTPQALAEFSPASPPSDLANGREIAFEARSTPPGSFTKPLTTDSGVLLVYVISKELRKRDESATTRATMTKSLDGMTRNDLFRAWFERRYTEAAINADILLRSAIASQ